MESMITDGMAFALPIFIMAVGGIYSEKSGITMLALEGLQGFGAFAGAISVLILKPALGENSPSLIYIAILMAMIGGMIYAMLHAVLSIRFLANQVISGVVVNILAVALTTFLTSLLNESLTGEASNKIQLGAAPRFTVPLISQIPILGAFFKDVYIFAPFILVFALIAWYVLYKTRYGLRLRACGENPSSVDAAGGSVSTIRFTAVMICGALSGLAGIFFAYSTSANFSPSIYMGYGYLSIAAFIFGNWKILPTLAVCLFFGLAKSGGYQLTLALGLSSKVSDLFLTLPYILTLLLLIFFSKHNHPPRAVGEPFDSGK
ncbi:MAG: ABC transporter permease [Flexilinea sp.]